MPADWSAIDDVVCDIMMGHGPDGHIDGHEAITDFIVFLLGELTAAEAQKLVYEARGWTL